jgi:two-component system response regulator MtrA
VDVAIGRLRARVGDDPADPSLILTVRGAGYKAARAG